MCKASALSNDEQMELFKKIKEWEEEGIRALKEQAELESTDENGEKEEMSVRSKIII